MKKIIFSLVLAGMLSSCGNASNEAFDKSKEITVVTREEGSGTRGAFTEMFGILEKTESTETDNTTEGAIVSNKTGVVMTTVSQDKYAIGYISLGSLNESVKTVDINGVTPSVENILNGSYESARPFLIVTKDNSNELANDFISFILSKEGQEIIGNEYVPNDENAQTFVSTSKTGKLSVGGSTSVAPIMGKIAEKYIELNPSVTIDIQETGSSAGISGTIEGTLDIGMSSRDLKEKEESELTKNIIAYDGLAVIVNNENPIKDLTPENVKEIFTGEVTTWDELYE